MEFVEDLHAEQRAALEAELANEQLQRHGIDQERQRAGQQFELNDQFQNQGSSFNNPLAGASIFNDASQNQQQLGTSGLSESTVIIDGGAQAINDMEDISENQSSQQ